MPVIIAGIAWLLWVLLVYFLANLLKLSGSDRTIFITALGLVGALTACLVLWWYRKKKSSAPLPTGDDRMSLLLREAAQRLATSPTAPAKKMEALPALLVIGEPGSAKTTSIARAGVNEALLAGNVWNGQLVAATDPANLWLAGNWIVAEIGGNAIEDAKSVRRLIDALRAGKATQLLGSSAQAPRSVLVAVDVSTFYQKDAAGIQAMARKLRGVLTAAATSWGSRLPVYVLFTKIDAIAFFHDFVRQLDQAEAARFLGVRMPFTTSGGAVWDQQETERLQSAFDTLFLRLDGWRRELLIREPDVQGTPNVYEFPREFRKLREPVVRFLLDLTRPNPLEATPMLRGFYFSGVRPVVIETRHEAPAQAAPAPVQPGLDDFAATVVFSSKKQQQFTPPPPTVGTKRVPQWTFLPEFITGQVFHDQIAMQTSGQFAGASKARKILLGTICVLAGAYFLGASVSFFRNFSFENRAVDAGRTLARTTGSTLTPTAASALDQLRAAVVDVGNWETSGAPFWQRWGVYPGRPLYENTRAAYCKSLDRFVLAGVREGMRKQLAALPSVPGANDQYDPSYRALKAYLMMTSEGKNAQADFLFSELQSASAAGGGGMDFREHFRVYARERVSGFCPAMPDTDAVETARNHLIQFPVVERVYRNILTELDAKFPKARYTDPQNAVVFLNATTKQTSNTGEVSGAFTKPAFAAGLEAIRQADQYVGREPWVLGPRGSQAGGGNLSADLRSRYLKDYMDAWNAYLASATVARYRNLNDAAAKLQYLSGNETPMLGVFCLAAEHTAVDAAELKTAFQPVQGFTTPDTCKTSLQGDKNKGYLSSLGSLFIGVDSVARNNAQDLPQAAEAKGAALAVARDLAMNATAQDFLMQPIVYAEDLVRGKLPSDINSGGAAFCAQLQPLFRKVPFAAKGAPAAVEEVNGVFQPGNGLLTQFFNSTLQQYLTQLGDRFMPVSGAKITVSEAFLNFYNRAHGISRTLYKANPAGPPAFNYVVRVEPSPNMTNFELRIDGQSLRGTKSGGQQLEFKYPGDGSGVRFTTDNINLPFAGQWAAFEFFRSANRQPSPTIFEWDLKTTFGGATTTSGPTAVLRLSVDMRGGANIFGRPGMEMTCVSSIARK